MNRTVPVVFDAGVDLLGMMTQPSEPRGSLAVVICSPLLHQNITSYRPLRTLAERLGNLGIPTLRFDWPGSGDSADPDVPGVGAWTNAVHEAVDVARRRTHADSVAVVGLRIGAMLGLVAAATNPAISDLALLAPFPSGRAYLRDLRAFQALADDGRAAGVARSEHALPAGALEASGFVLSPREVSDLEAIDLETLDLSTISAGRALIVTIQPETRVAALAARLSDSGLSVTHETMAETARLLEGTNQSVLMPRLGDLVCRWLERSNSTGAERLARPTSARPRAQLRVRPGAVHEEAVVLETARGRLVGVTCDQAKRSSRAAGWIVFLNAARVRKVGPNRLWTRYARAWAEVGTPSLRFDLSGVGDSDGDSSEDVDISEDESRHYRSGLVAEVLHALEWLGETRGAARFGIVGLCSGATLGFHVAECDERVCALALLNPRLLIWDEHSASLRAWTEAKDLALRPRAWRSLMRHGVRSWASNAAHGASLAARGRASEESHRREILESLRSFQARGVATTLLFCAGDLGIPYFERYVSPDYQDVLADLGVEVEVVDGPDHTFRPLWSQEYLQGSLERLFRTAGLLAERDERVRLRVGQRSNADRRPTVLPRD